MWGANGYGPDFAQHSARTHAHTHIKASPDSHTHLTSSSGTLSWDHSCLDPVLHLQSLNTASMRAKLGFDRYMDTRFVPKLLTWGRQGAAGMEESMWKVSVLSIVGWINTYDTHFLLFLWINHMMQASILVSGPDFISIAVYIGRFSELAWRLNLMEAIFGFYIDFWIFMLMQKFTQIQKVYIYYVRRA